MEKLWFKHCEAVASAYKEALYFDQERKNAFFSTCTGLVNEIPKGPTVPPLSFDTSVDEMKKKNKRDVIKALKGLAGSKWFDRLCMACLPKMKYDHEKLEYALELATLVENKPFVSIKVLKKMEARRSKPRYPGANEMYLRLVEFNANYRPVVKEEIMDEEDLRFINDDEDLTETDDELEELEHRLEKKRKIIPVIEDDE